MDETRVDAVVVGAGIAGLYQVYRLREMGLSVRGIEAAPDIGGTWYWNSYPGARVDSPAYTYQYWFSEELLDEWQWSERFPSQPEIKRYLNYVATKFSLQEMFTFNTRVNRCDWLEEKGCWRVETSTGECIEAQFLISCVGMLSAPKIPPFPEHETFTGEIYHTARWPQQPVSLKGKRVGVIGTGATGIQVIQTIAAEVDELVVFQRTAQYAVKMNNYPLTAELNAYWRTQYPALKESIHTTFGGFEWALPEIGWAPSLSREERLALLEECWQDGSLKMWVGTYPEVLADPEMNQEASEFVREKIRKRIDNPALEDALVPRAYGFGTYRVPLENGYYDVFNRANVTLIDVNENPITAFYEKGLIVGGQPVELDIVILATGFDAGTGSLRQMNIHGRNGCSLSALWGQDIRSTLGLQVHGFPNLFTVAGPLAPSTAFCNMTTCLQQQVDWVTDAIVYMRAHAYTSMEPTEARQDEWVAHHDEVANMTLLTQTKSWYTGANIEGKPIRLLSYIGGVGTYRDICNDIQSAQYPGFEFTP
jgi:cation diffusion facilitator CzcD-associated flavoprotein CzcO